MPLGTGAAVELRDLVSRKELNGIIGRVLKRDANTGRYGVRLPPNSGGGGGLLVAVKLCNLAPVPPLPSGEGVWSATSLLELPGDILGCHVCPNMSVRSLLRFSATCVLLRSLVTSDDDEDSICAAPLAHSYHAPYHDPESGLSRAAYRRAAKLRDSWHKGPDCRSAVTVLPRLSCHPHAPLTLTRTLVISLLLT